MRIDEKGWLLAESGEAEVVRFPTVRTMPLAVSRPLGIVWHWTAGRGGPGFGERLARMAQTYQRGIDRAASWHVLIAKDGAVYQSAPFLIGTWHVGKPGVIAGAPRFANINQATVGCELENAGRLRKIGDRFFCWPYWLNPGAPAHELRPDPRCLLEDARAAAVAGEGVFDAFPPAQVASATALLQALVAAYGWSREASSHGHVDFDYPRKEDPGALWKREHLPSVLDAVFGGGSVAPVAPAPKLAQGG